MGKSRNRITVITIFIFILVTFIGFGSKNYFESTFNIEELQHEMKVKNYNFEVQNAEKDLLPTTKKRMIIGNEAVDIYLFNSDKKMENEAKFIDSDGFGYENGSKAVKVDWVSSPHFYKKGSIIVQYIGENKKIISDLKDILGDQFAGI